MANQAENQKSSDANTGGMPLMIKAQYTKDLSFENPNILKILQGLKENPEVNVDVNVDAESLGGDDYEVTLSIRVEAKTKEESLFIADLAYGGIFGIAPDVPKDSVNAFILIECPRLLFPYARNIISEVTRDGGVPPIALHPIDFVGLYHKKMEEEKGSKGETKQ